MAYGYGLVCRNCEETSSFENVYMTADFLADTVSIFCPNCEWAETYYVEEV